ncbi:Elongation of fatty acids protein 2 [Borealophlyctis nickersoniae]|nr:Elongation of fatty acids protein 2 [Borealophlyctis nickersoniae]
MGIKSLKSSLSRFAKGSTKWRPIADFAGRRVAIDASIYLYRYLRYYPKAYQIPAQYPPPEFKAHIYGLHTFVTRLLQYGIKPILVFDNGGSEARNLAKQVERERRAKRHAAMSTRIKQEMRRVDRLESLKEILEKVSQSPLENQRDILRRVKRTLDLDVVLTAPEISGNTQSSVDVTHSGEMIPDTVATQLVTLRRKASQSISRHPMTIKEPKLFDEILGSECVEQTHLAELNDFIDRQKHRARLLQKQVACVTPEIRAECTELLDLMNIPYFISPPDFEAESICASLANAGVVDAIVTDDTDACVLTDKPVLQKLFQPPPPDVPVDHALVVDMPEARKEMNFSKEQARTFPGTCTLTLVGPVKAYKLLSEHKSIEDILDAFKKSEDAAMDDTESSATQASVEVARIYQRDAFDEPPSSSSKAPSQSVPKSNLLKRHAPRPGFDYAMAREALTPKFPVPAKWKEELDGKEIGMVENEVKLQEFLDRYATPHGLVGEPTYVVQVNLGTASDGKALVASA